MDAKPQHDLRDALLLFLAASLMAVATVHLKSFNPFIKANASVIVAFGFLALTAAAIRLRRETAGGYGLDLRHTKSECLFVLLLCAVIFPFYFIGFKIYWNPPSPFEFRLALPWWLFVLNHLLVVALPEEFLFRGFIQQRLGAVMRGRVKILGFPLGWHIPAASVLFALGHFVIDFNPNRLATFFPALFFGALRDRKGSLIGCILFHAACNIYSDLIVWGFYPK